ncbi:CRISPR-associated protein Cas4 [Porphyromonas pogonae]|uniref:CRISPR-associated protein Cas4 n=1 Tax=Porphyromonas pogonae TaxID=867595 RepID=UPI002E77CCAA|nr:CRISPR-associated protein Cas4 [Porphyromonas pogonae]
MFEDEQLLMISGIQHYAFCPTQWCLVYLDQFWQDNELTVGGHLLHKHVDNPKLQPLEQGIRHIHSMHLASYTIGVYGIADIVAFESHRGGMPLYPIEYKHGKPKRDNVDAVQLCAQAICLEEMYNCEIKYGYIYYGKTRQRTQIDINTSLRKETLSIITKMHTLMSQNGIVRSTKSNKCNKCSLQDICMPLSEHTTSAQEYLRVQGFEL